MRENENFGNWKIESAAEEFLQNQIAVILNKCPNGEKWAKDLHEHTAIKLRDIIDHITFNEQEFISSLKTNGWEDVYDGVVFKNKKGYFPEFIFEKDRPKVFIKTEFVSDFLSSNGIKSKISGKKDDQIRKAKIFDGNDLEFWVIERHGCNGYRLKDSSDETLVKSRIHQQAFRARRREFDNIEKGLDHLEVLVDSVVADIGNDWTCDLFLRAEREYWMQKNKAGRIQKERQDRFGIGWANQDHHTFDSSRQHFYQTIRILEKLGFECRELFYAGDGAGWGSQILEQPVLKSVIFADIDLAPEELEIDFAHSNDIKPLHPLRRAGLWCAMHGESMLKAGLNHLECMYDARKFNGIFKELKIEMMHPFSDFPHLYQALTVGEWWSVDPYKIDRLLEEGHISDEAASNFKQYGAIGSHFENLERNCGFKGFNKPGIDKVLSAIDPRKQLV